MNKEPVNALAKNVCNTTPSEASPLEPPNNIKWDGTRMNIQSPISNTTLIKH